MNREAVLLAVEDRLSAAVGESVLTSLGMSAFQIMGLQGYPYLKKRAPELNRAASRLGVLLLTDLDDPESCAPAPS